MNRRNFITKLLSIPVAAVGLTQVVSSDVVAKQPPRNSSDLPKKTVKPPLKLKKCHTAKYPMSMYELNARRMYQEELTTWMRDKVDETVFKMMTKGK